ncbi:hypothetical protein PpBr36_00033 [Pyricularia pennisetigena]|uniref:hypothetical protein n=1 Tax=Pyricularia pennisetigena TaxID=1578925 RepID=UPI00114E1ECD|nr:hypothetical protein PpBr36_00033 [Pyricularia pennisetigena]TLS28197.1 hypothetical protein PpBr36_00033 [Pyricularia pennisetigena]
MSFVTIKCAIKHSKSGKYLSIDGRGVTSPSATGAGKVSLSAQIGVNETLYLEKWGDNVWSIRAPNSPGVFLRFEGAAVLKMPKGEMGTGTVNCQYTQNIHPGPSDHAMFRLVTQASGNNGIESISVPGTFLRSDGAEVINVQNIVGPFQGSPSWRSDCLSVIILIVNSSPVRQDQIPSCDMRLGDWGRRLELLSGIRLEEDVARFSPGDCIARCVADEHLLNAGRIDMINVTKIHRLPRWFTEQLHPSPRLFGTLNRRLVSDADQLHGLFLGLPEISRDWNILFAPSRGTKTTRVQNITWSADVAEVEHAWDC